jgi:hypothetical protein
MVTVARSACEKAQGSGSGVASAAREVLGLLLQRGMGRDRLHGFASAECVSAWKSDRVFGVIGFPNCSDSPLESVAFRPRDGPPGQRTVGFRNQSAWVCGANHPSYQTDCAGRLVKLEPAKSPSEPQASAARHCARNRRKRSTTPDRGSSDGKDHGTDFLPIQMRR